MRDNIYFLRMASFTPIDILPLSYGASHYFKPFQVKMALKIDEEVFKIDVTLALEKPMVNISDSMACDYIEALMTIARGLYKGTTPCCSIKRQSLVREFESFPCH
jgi:hypothetical protein